jgi:EmrB/QacA subfamily drug resistance transporter
VLGSGAVFLESTVVNVALPSIARTFDLTVAGLQWVINGYFLTLSALMLLGGALGDHFSRPRVFALGAMGFAGASLACALAPSLWVLVICRVVQGVAGALLVPNSLAMLESVFAGEERGIAIGRWAAWSSVSTALGPLAGGMLVDAGSWRWVFASVVPFAAAAAWVALRHGEGAGAKARSTRHGRRDGVDYAGAVLVTLGLAGIVSASITGPEQGFTSPLLIAEYVGGIACLVAFIIQERRTPHPLLPLSMFASRAFAGVNIATLFIYAALSALIFLLMLQLQNVLGYDALRAGASLLPVNALMLLLSPRVGKLAERIGARIPIAAGAIIAGVGMVLFTRVRAGTSYVDTLLPATIVFGLGLSTLVAPLTATALAAADRKLAGVASAINNAAARLAGLLATAAVPLAVGRGGAQQPRGAALATGFVRGMWISAALCAAGALVAWVTLRRPPDDARA